MVFAARFILVLGLTAVVAGCAGTAVITSEYLTSTYHPRFLNSVAKYGALRTQIVGNPFDAPKQEVDAAITRVMSRAHPGPQFPLVTSPDEPARRSPYRVVVLFDPASYLARNQVCVGDTRQGQPVAGRIRMLMVFCTGSYAISSLVAQLPSVASPDDSRFAAALGQATITLMPPTPAEPDAAGDLEIS